jgi:anti-anti-sigma factor
MPSTGTSEWPHGYPASAQAIQAEGPTSMTLAILRERAAGEYVVRLVGEFHAPMADAVSEALLSTLEPSVTLDLSELSSIDTAGLQTLVSVSDHLGRDGTALHVVGAGGAVLTAVRSSGLVPSSSHQPTSDLPGPAGAAPQARAGDADVERGTGVPDRGRLRPSWPVQRSDRR